MEDDEFGKEEVPKESSAENTVPDQTKNWKYQITHIGIKLREAA